MNEGPPLRHWTITDSKRIYVNIKTIHTFVFVVSDIYQVRNNKLCLWRNQR